MKRKKALYALLILIILLACSCLIIPQVKSYLHEQQEESYIRDEIVEIAPQQTVLLDAEKEESEPYGTGAHFSFTGSIELTLNSVSVFNEASKYFSYPPSQIYVIEDDHNPSKYNYVELSYTLKNINARSTNENDISLLNALFPACFIERPHENIRIESTYFDSSEVENPEDKLWQLIRIPQGTEKTYKLGYLISKEYDLDHVMISYGDSTHYKYRTYPAKYSALSK